MSRELWQRYKRELCICEELGLTLDLSRMRFPQGFLVEWAPALSRAFDAMAALERGALANPDEKRRVGHYWLRSPELAPDPQIRQAIEDTVVRIKAFAAQVHAGELAPERSPRFKHLLVIGIGGSALGPQLAADALWGAQDALEPHFLDNTDPDGIDRLLARLSSQLDQTLAVVISKSGGTPETRNGMVEVERAFRARGLSFARHAVAVTGEGSALDRTALSGGWLARFPMWDWVGGRTSETSAVGLLPAALQGLDIDGLLEGARAADEATREREVARNPAALLALAWHHAGGGRGEKDMVVLPYKDRLVLFSRYLQQLVMESLGKRLDLNGKRVEQGIAVYGNKGSTDQHAYVQQLRDGLPNFFATFIQVLEDRQGPSEPIDGGATAGDFLMGFLLGTRDALYEQGRESVTLRVNDVSARSLGVLIAVFERAVGLYASLVNINAYHQPGVEAGKSAAARVLALQARVADGMRQFPQGATAESIAERIGEADQAELVFKVLEHLSANPGRGVRALDGARSPKTLFAPVG